MVEGSRELRCKNEQQGISRGYHILSSNGGFASLEREVFIAGLSKRLRKSDAKQAPATVCPLTGQSNQKNAHKEDTECAGFTIKQLNTASYRERYDVFGWAVDNNNNIMLW